MKKSISVILLISFMFLTLFGCTPTNTPDDIDNNSVPAFVDPINNYDTIDDSSTEGFVIKSKKYDYEDNNVVIMNVENQSNNNYIVIVDITYYDDNGKEITKETQSFEGFASNWQKYFLFNPGKAFSSYDYKLTTKNFNGECYGKAFTFDHNVEIAEARAHLGEDENGKDKGMGRGIFGRILYKYECPELLDLWVTSILFDNKGEIYRINGMTMLGGKSPYIENKYSIKLVVGTKDSVEWPEELKGDINGILILNNIGIGINPPPVA